MHTLFTFYVFCSGKVLIDATYILQLCCIVFRFTNFIKRLKLSWWHSRTLGNLSTVLYSHYIGVIMNTMASQITGVSIVCSAVCSGADKRKHPSPASLPFVRVIHRWPLDSPQKGPATRKCSFWQCQHGYHNLLCFDTVNCHHILRDYITSTETVSLPPFCQWISL